MQNFCAPRFLCDYPADSCAKDRGVFLGAAISIAVQIDADKAARILG